MSDSSLYPVVTEDQIQEAYSKKKIQEIELGAAK